MLCYFQFTFFNQASLAFKISVLKIKLFSTSSLRQTLSNIKSRNRYIPKLIKELSGRRTNKITAFMKTANPGAPIQKIVHPFVLPGEKQNQGEYPVNHHDDPAVDEMEDPDRFPGNEQVGYHDDGRHAVLVDVNGVDVAVEEKEPVNRHDDYRRVQAERAGDCEELMEKCVFFRCYCECKVKLLLNLNIELFICRNMLY